MRFENGLSGDRAVDLLSLHLPPGDTKDFEVAQRREARAMPTTLAKGVFEFTAIQNPQLSSAIFNYSRKLRLFGYGRI
jgi:hypothetical protein